MFLFILTFIQLTYIISSKQGKAECGVYQTLHESEVILMLENAFLQLLVFSLIMNVFLAIISLILITFITIHIIKENRISANH